MKKIILFFFVLVSLNSSGQNILPDTFERCSFSSFSLESRTTGAMVSDEEFKKVVKKGLGDKLFKRIHGTLTLQIIVDTLGNSCLLSMSNHTNYPEKKLDELKSAIDSDLKWNKLDGFVSVTVQVKITETHKITIKRFGFDSYAGFVEISDKPLPPVKKLSARERNKNTTNNPYVVVDKDNNSMWMHFTSKNSIILDNRVTNIDCQKDGVVWFSTRYCIVRSENNAWTVFDDSNTPITTDEYGNLRVSGLFVDDQDRVWVSTWNKFFIYDNKKWYTADSLFRDELNFSCDSVVEKINLVTKEVNGTVWLQSYASGSEKLMCFKDNLLTDIHVPKSLFADNFLGDVYTAKNNVIWFTSNLGLVKLDGGEYTVYNMENSLLPSNSVAAVEGDDFGNIWVALTRGSGTGRGGLIKIGVDGEWSLYNAENSNLPDDNFFDIKIDGKVLWLVISGALLRFENGVFTTFDSNNSTLTKDSHVFSFLIDKNRFKWLGTMKGLSLSNVK